MSSLVLWASSVAVSRLASCPVAKRAFVPAPHHQLRAYTAHPAPTSFSACAESSVLGWCSGPVADACWAPYNPNCLEVEFDGSGWPCAEPVQRVLPHCARCLINVCFGVRVHGWPDAVSRRFGSKEGGLHTAEDSIARPRSATVQVGLCLPATRVSSTFSMAKQRVSNYATAICHARRLAVSPPWCPSGPSSIAGASLSLRLGGACPTGLPSPMILLPAPCNSVASYGRKTRSSQARLRCVPGFDLPA